MADYKGLEVIDTTGDGGTLIINNFKQIADWNEEGNVNFVKALGTDLTASGIKTTMTVDSGASNTAFGQAYHMDTDGELVNADADKATTMPCVALGLEASTGAISVLLQGFIRNDTWNWTVGAFIYASTDPTTTCGLTQTAPSGSGDQVQSLGYAVTADIIYFNPSTVLVEIN